MGNKLCKKKVDNVDGEAKSQTPFDRIITRLHLRPNSWKSDPNLNSKHANSNASNPNENGPSTKKLRPLSNSRSSDWTEVALEVPEKEEVVHLRNPQLSLIFNSDGTPTPPPRKHKKGLREKIESVARSGLQALQPKKPVDEPLCVKKQYNYGCPMDDHDHAHHNRDHKHGISQDKKQDNSNKLEQKNNKENKRKKNLSVVSLPNYNDLKLSLVKSDSNEIKPNGNNVRDSALSLPGESKGKLGTYMTRCRSFGSLFPQNIANKLKTRKVPADIESDDSFGPLEDWDLRIIEHYNPKDASLPRPRKPEKPKSDVLSDVECLIVSNEEASRPIPPVRRSESLLKKLNRKASETAAKRQSSELLNQQNSLSRESGKDTPMSITPPPSPEPKISDPIVPVINYQPRNEEGKVEHSNLLKILEDFSIKDKKKELSIEEESIPHIDEVEEDKVVSEKSSDFPSLTPSLVEFEKNMTNAVEDFINTERTFVEKDLHFGKFNSLSLPQNTAVMKT